MASPREELDLVFVWDMVRIKGLMDENNGFGRICNNYRFMGRYMQICLPYMPLM